VVGGGFFGGESSGPPVEWVVADGFSLPFPASPLSWTYKTGFHWRLPNNCDCEIFAMVDV